MKKPAFIVIYESIKNDIISGRLADGGRLPTEPELAARFAVSIGTLRRATERLEESGFLRREQGRGTFACLPEEQCGKNTDAPQFGILQPLNAQEQINSCLFAGGCHFRTVQLPSPCDIKPELSEFYQKSSLLQLPLTAFALPEIHTILSPLPETIAAKTPPELLRECRTPDGAVRLLPIINNPSLCYCRRAAFAAAGLELPASDWNYAELLDICRRLKAAGSRTPFCVQPFAGLLFENALSCFDTDFFTGCGNRENFRTMTDFFLTLKKEELSYYPYGQAITFQDIFNEPLADIVFHGPRALSGIAAPEEWELRPLPGNASSSVIFGLAVPVNAPDKNAAFELLRRICATPSPLAYFTDCAPALPEAMRHWVRNCPLPGGEFFVSPEVKRTVLSGRNGFERWHQKVYAALHDAVSGRLNADAAFDIITVTLEQNRIHPGEYRYFF